MRLALDSCVCSPDLTPRSSATQISLDPGNWKLDNVLLECVTLAEGPTGSPEASELARDSPEPGQKLLFRSTSSHPSLLPTYAKDIAAGHSPLSRL